MVIAPGREDRFGRRTVLQEKLRARNRHAIGTQQARNSKGASSHSANPLISPDGATGSRTPDLLNAIQALSQLSYSPGMPYLCIQFGRGCQADLSPFRQQSRRRTESDAG